MPESFVLVHTLESSSSDSAHPAVLASLADGDSVEQILGSFPTVTETDVSLAM